MKSIQQPEVQNIFLLARGIIQKSLKSQIWNQSLTQNAWEEMIAFWKVLEVEEVTWRPEVETSPARTLQFSTSVELYRQKVVS